MGWKGYWIDAASLLRMEKDTIIPLDPVNIKQISQGLKNGIKTFAGSNCSASIALMGTYGLFKQNLVEWVSMMTYQAVSGAGAKAVLELSNQNLQISNQYKKINLPKRTGDTRNIGFISISQQLKRAPHRHYRCPFGRKSVGLDRQ